MQSGREEPGAGAGEDSTLHTMFHCVPEESPALGEQVCRQEQAQSGPLS